MLNEQELKEKIARWAGINLEGVPRGCEPDFPHSLDALFKWVVPLCDCYGLTLDIRDGTHLGWVEKDNFIYGVERAETPALALCLAVEKLIDNVK